MRPPQPSREIAGLLRLARGDREAVHAAIRAEADAGTGVADLGRVVARLVNRAPRAR